MATCKECLHIEACLRALNIFGINSIDENIPDAEKNCNVFKYKSQYAEMPCKVGDKIYQTDGVLIYTSTINKIIYDTESIAFDETAIGNSVFLSLEEAKKALSERAANYGRKQN